MKKKVSTQSDKTLIQFFDGRGSFDDLCEVSKAVKDIFPNGVVIGATTAGEIIDGKMLDGHLVASVSVFEHTQIIGAYESECDASGGYKMGERLGDAEIKAAILFSDGLFGKPEEFICALSQKMPQLIMSGGAAADNYEFNQTAISLNGAVYTKGVVAAGLKNKELLIKNSWRLNWEPIGRLMQITKADGNVVQEIDSKPILDVIERYFGESVVKNLPYSIVGFPLIKTEANVHIARAPIAVSDKALVFAGELKTGDFVRFGIANIESIGGEGDDFYEFKPEGIWIYSCAGRKAFAKNTLEKEFSLYSKLGSSAGFFTYGEFFKTQNSTNMLNLTTSAIAISEKYIPAQKLENHTANGHSGESEISAVAHLTNSIVKELEQIVKTLDSYKIVLDSNSIVSKTDKRGIITYVNDLFVEVSGYQREELIGRSHNIIRHPDMERSIFDDMWSVITSGKIWKGVVKNKAKNGAAYYVDTSIVPLFDETGKIVEYIAARTDLTKIIEQQKTIEKQKIDALTKLPNRVRFFEDLESADNPFAALVNIDEFGNINRFYGFETGDEIILELAGELGRFCEESGYAVYKFDADNFLVLSFDSNQISFSHNIEKLSNRLHSITFLRDLLDIKLRFTVGIASSKRQLLSKTEEALKKARIKRTNIAILNEEDEKNKLQNFEMLKVLDYAINNDGVIPYYQPIVSLDDSKTIKYEGLMRLRDRDGKIYTPFSFLEVAKKSKYYPSLTRAMIDKILADFKDRAEGVCINLSMLDIESDICVQKIKESLLSFGDPERITFEITESETSEDYERIIAFISDIKSIGAKISIDDFGSGYSNFAYLARFRADFLKIDGSIIKNIAHDEDSFKIASVIVDFAKKMGMKTVGEFVSSKEIAKKAKEIGIDLGQGYLYSEPKPIHSI